MAGKIKEKSGAGENMVLDMSNGTVRAINVLSQGVKQEYLLHSYNA